jgi:HSP20 family protein
MDRRRRRWPFDFDIDDEIERMERMMERLFEDAMRLEEQPEKPFVYGFSMRVGPDGKPVIREFGNTARRPELRGEREPLTDVIEHDHDVSATMELPGVGKEDINLTTTESTLTVDVDTPQRRYHKVVDLPCKIKPDTTKATYKNGVLDVVMEKGEGEGTGFRVGVQ